MSSSKKALNDLLERIESDQLVDHHAIARLLREALGKATQEEEAAKEQAAADKKAAAATKEAEAVSEAPAPEAAPEEKEVPVA